MERAVTRILVIGGGGFVGRGLIAALASSGWAQTIEENHPAQLAGHLEKVDAVVNCVTGRPADILAVAATLYPAAIKSGRGIPIIHLGSMTVYGSAVGQVAENAPLRADLGTYSQAQLAADQLAASYPASIRLRPGCEYGPGCEHWTGKIARCLLQHRLGDLGPAGDGYCNLIYIDDLIVAIAQLLSRRDLQGRVFNLAMPEPPTWNQYFVAFAKALGAVPVRRVTGRRLTLESKLLAPPLKVAQVVLAAVGAPSEWLPPPITPSVLSSCRQELSLDASLAQVQMGLKWTPLDIGLARAAQWCLH
jgi:nucleoside-diphosphate-sugar epimerase